MKGSHPAGMAVLFAFCLALAGCGESQPVLFTHDPRLDGEDFKTRPQLRAKVIEATNRLYGDSPAHLRAPEGSGLPGEAPAPVEGEGEGTTASPTPGPAAPAPLAAGEALYRRHCLHCHGVTGDGMGPTAPYVYPVPRDYRPGKFKFTSTGYGLKPSRLDLTRSIVDGLDGTSMPAFSAQLTPEEIQQVIDYVLYLSMRGETEVAFALEASAYEDADAELFDAPLQDELAYSVFERWRESAEPTPATDPASPRPEPTAESIERGRQLFLGTTTDVKLECVTCHGPRGDGAGSSWVDPETFNQYVFGGKPGAEQLEKLRDFADKNGGKKWSDDWGNPLRPADLNKGIYKGGRRPIDLYWRIANGITGTPMPAHASALKDPDDLWHLVNFILALPHDSALLLPRRADMGLAASPEPPSDAGSTD